MEARDVDEVLRQARLEEGLVASRRTGYSGWVTASEKEAFIRARCATRASPDAVMWSVHAVGRMAKLRWLLGNVEMSLAACELVEDYEPAHRGLPDCLVLAFVNGAPVHAVVAADVPRNRILIVTVYAPSLSRWKHDWKTRT